jgi:hypothetical protein
MVPLNWPLSVFSAALSAVTSTFSEVWPTCSTMLELMIEELITCKPVWTVVWNPGAEAEAL